jgi:polypyrimidine tract-binding protein 1
MKRTFSGDEFDINGDGLGNSNSQMMDIAKKSRSEPALPSRVVHLRNIEANELEVVQLGLPFGRVTNFLNLRKKAQAFLEFDATESAKQMVDYFTSVPAMMNGRQVFVQYSNHGELRTDPTNRTNQQAHVALAQATDLYETAQKGGPNCVLRVSIINVLFPVTIDVLYQIFSKFGTVLKIITFTKNDKFQALIQLKDANAAAQTKLHLHGQNIYNGCCTLQIEYSKLHSLAVKFNNDKSRDYTNPTLPSGEGPTSQQQELDRMQSNANLLPLQRSSSNDDYRYDYYNATARGRPPSTSGASSYDMQAGGNHLMNPLQTPSAAYNPMTGGAAPPYGHPYGSVHHQAPPMHGLPPSHVAAAHMHAVHQQAQQQQNSHMMSVQNGPVILVSNLNEDMTTPESLFTLFGVYGDVHRVKILFNKKDSALIQFAAPQQAAVAHQNLDHVTMFGKQIKVSFSKHQFVQMPKDGASDMGLTKDFTNSPLHRFKKPGSKNYNNIFPPGTVLHLSNIPNETSEDEIRNIFSQYGTIKRFKFFEKDHKMALIEMETIEDAIAALVNTHNYRLADSMHLRVSFSKSKL